jgi:uncharacterized glyoxalase superfamily protein PhnB
VENGGLVEPTLSLKRKAVLVWNVKLPEVTDGRVVVSLEKTFWAARFGMLVDRFGIPWLINCEGSDQLPEG